MTIFIPLDEVQLAYLKSIHRTPKDYFNNLIGKLFRVERQSISIAISH